MYVCQLSGRLRYCKEPASNFPIHSFEQTKASHSCHLVRDKDRPYQFEPHYGSLGYADPIGGKKRTGEREEGSKTSHYHKNAN